ncbi:choice-of-anchor A family protein [Streptomyces sp. 549]|uniref:choice-of-anchor A family protein n=1 Tax=Streptomyces sp. 549 TaxID=3049076 RepID=UPI0024C2A9A1|nr:choice-of-anchor A family protein [Streptomyces sp. 549]MDK1473999.1 choice-of-anchor A family protein [Streptomyces sp. 549]
MRLPPRVAALCAGAVLALPTPAAAAAPQPQGSPAPASRSAAPCADRLGTAGYFGEFVERDAVRSSRTDGAVAFGGDADLSGGLSVGGRTTAAHKLPGGASLLVGGTLRNGPAGSEDFTVVERGTAVYGGLRGRPPVLKSGSGAQQGRLPVDVAAEFRELRSLSSELNSLPARGSVTRTTRGGETTLTLAGDRGLNVFPVSASQLHGANHVVVDTPPGATALVNVAGGSYDMRTAATRDISGPRGLAASVLWNFPDATAVTQQNGTTWPGTLLAPRAAVRLSPGAHLRGAVIARSLDAERTETRHTAFTGCLDPRAASGAVPAPAAPAPATDLAETGGGQLPALLGGALGALAAGTGLAWSAHRRARRRT